MRVIGLTGGFGTGKTTVAKMFKEKRALVIDADKLAHQLIKPKTKEWKKIVTHFGQTILKDNSQIDRSKLGAMVFKNKKELKRLTEIIHPAVMYKIKALIRKYKKAFPRKIIIVDVPLLFEAGLDSLMDKLIVVKCSLTRQISRLQSKSGLTRREILRRINYQLPMPEKMKLADFVIDNDGSLSETREQVNQIYQELL